MPNEIDALLQSLLAFLAGGGLFSLMNRFYERRQENRNKMRQDFRASVLTPDFFEFLTARENIRELLGLYIDFKKGTRKLVWINCSYVNMEQIDFPSELERLQKESTEAFEKMKRQGTFFLVPKSLRSVIREAAFEDFDLFRKELTEAEPLVKRYSEVSLNISRRIREILGFSDL